MDRAEAFERLEYLEVLSRPTGKCTIGGEDLEALRMALAALREQDVPDANVGKWISVKERLPKAREDVLCVTFWHECYQTRIGWYNEVDNVWYILTTHGEFQSRTVTHWMPLPEPPKEGAEG